MWTIRYEREAERAIDALDSSVRRRLRVGDWRVIYTLDGDVLVVVTVAVGHRREVYR